MHVFCYENLISTESNMMFTNHWIITRELHFPIKKVMYNYKISDL